MAITQWDERYSVGVESLDEQHRWLFNFFFTLLESSNSKLVPSALGKLKDYISLHFKLEEELMAKCEYPELEYHKLKHKEFCEEIHILCLSNTMNGEKLTIILKNLYEWLVDHVCSLDKQYAPYLTGQATITT